MDDLTKSLMISAAGMRAQSTRMRVIAENLANAETVGLKPGDEPYRRKTVSFANHLDRATGTELVAAGPVGRDPSAFGLRYEPGHPAADAGGYVRTPNVEPLLEVTDMRQAQRSYEANLSAIEAARTMLMRAVDLLKG